MRNSPPLGFEAWPIYAHELRCTRSSTVNTCTCGEVGDEGEVLKNIVQSGRNGKAALKLIRKFLMVQGFVTDAFDTDKLFSYIQKNTSPVQK